MKITNLIRSNHGLIASKTGGGKTSLLRSMFLEDMVDDSGDPVFRVHIFADFESILMYKKLGIPIFRTAEEVFYAYREMRFSHVVFDPLPEMVSGIDREEEVRLLLSMIFNFKVAVMSNGDMDTYEAYILIDEMQRINSKYSMSSELEDIFLEGRKYKLWIIATTQRLQLVNNTSITQGFVGIGFMEYEDEYLKNYNLRSAVRPFEFTVKKGSKIYRLHGRKLKFSDLRKQFRMRFVQVNP